MNDIKMKIGTRLTLIWKEPGKERVEYYSKILDSTDEHLIIDYPIHKRTRRAKYFPVGTIFKVNFVGTDDAIYEFTADIVAKVKLEMPAIAIMKPNKDEVERIQRREFVRIDTSVDVAVHQQSKNHAFTTVTNDISGGGASIVVPKSEKLEEDEIVELWFVLPFRSGKYQYVRTASQVVFVREIGGVTLASFQFKSLNQKDQQLIISFCFEKQREMRKKEMS